MADAAFIRQEQARLRAHFARVLSVLESRDVSDWPGDLRRARRRSIRMVRGYARRGRFPVNTETAGWTPIFQDQRGTLCAMGHVAHQWGRPDLVAWVRANDNLVRLSERIPAPLAAWLPATGFTADEAALVQPTYSSCHDGWGMGCYPYEPPPTYTHAPPPVPAEATAPGWTGLAVATALALLPMAPVVFLGLRNLWHGAVVWRLPQQVAGGLVVAGGATLAAVGAVPGALLLG